MLEQNELLFTGAFMVVIFDEVQYHLCLLLFLADTDQYPISTLDWDSPTFVFLVSNLLFIILLARLSNSVKRTEALAANLLIRNGWNQGSTNKD